MCVRLDIRVVGRARTAEERRRRHLHGDRGARFSEGKYMVLLGRVSGCVTTLPAKDNLISEIYENDRVKKSERRQT